MYGVPGKRIDPAQIDDWLLDAEFRRPPLVGELRWKTFIEDARKFVADGWLKKAIDCEWLDFELFGCDPACDETMGRSPLDNPDEARTGLVCALAGRSVVGMNREWAVIRNLPPDDECRMHVKHLQYQARTKLLKPLVPIWDLPVFAETI